MSNKISRRKVLRTGLVTVAGIAGLGAAARIANRFGWIAPDYDNVFGAGELLTYGTQRLITSVRSVAPEFGRGDISTVHPVNHAHPRFEPYVRLAYDDFKDWRLYVDGLVSRPSAFSLADLKLMPARTQITQLTCEEGWSYIAAWTGVPLSYVLHLVGASPRAKWVVLYPFDDFWGSIDMPEAVHPQTLLTYAMNGDDLTLDHGAPLRLRIPRQLGYKNIKFIARIFVTDNLKFVGDGQGSAAPAIGYSWYGGI
jgi:DMSO/TMAO reductase YedYZ molybdopterin-dependent catalytic subunit